MAKQSDFITSVKPTWCLGCSNFSIRAALLNSFVELGLKPEQIAMVYDIGCLGNSASWFNVYGFHGLHGRTVPVAIGAKLANRDLTVIGLAGDGGAYGEGLNHLVEAARSNIDITLIVANNHLYSLTTGQASPTTEKGTKTKSTPQGTIKQSLNPLSLALASGASFAAQGYADEVKHLTELIKKGIEHKGFSLIDVLQPCLTINKKNTRDWYKQKIYKLSEKKPIKCGKTGIGETNKQGKIPIGIFNQEQKPTYLDNLNYLKKDALINQKRVNFKIFLEKLK